MTEILYLKSLSDFINIIREKIKIREKEKLILFYININKEQKIIIDL